MSSAVAPEEVVDPALVEAQAAVDAHEAAKVTDPPKPVVTPDPTAPKVEEPVVDPAETAEAKEARERDEAGRFKAKEVDYSKVILPKDAAIDPAVLERTVAIARARGLSTEQAQATVDLITQEVSTARADLLTAHAPGGAEWTKNLDTWKAETLADTTLGKTPEARKAAIALGGNVLKAFKVANPEMGAAMDTFLTESGIGERRELAHFLVWLGKSAGERSITMPTNHGVPKTMAEIFYPKGADRTEEQVRSDS